MRRRQFTSAIFGAWAVGLAPLAYAGLLEADAARGVRVALERGAEKAVSLLGRPDGFLGNPKVRIALPGVLAKAAKLLKATGQGQKVDDLVTAMNRAAEAAVPQARTLLAQAAKSMSVEDALSIVRGPDNSVTQFFASKTREPLYRQFLPIVARETERVALAEKYDALAAKAARLGLLNPEDSKLDQYVTGKSLDGLYQMIGDEERRIRRDPIGTGSEILKRVFAR